MSGNGKILALGGNTPILPRPPSPNAIAAWLKIGVIVVATVASVVVATIKLESWLDTRVREHLAPIAQRLDKIDRTLERLEDRLR